MHKSADVLKTSPSPALSSGATRVVPSLGPTMLSRARPLKKCLTVISHPAVVVSVRIANTGAQARGLTMSAKPLECASQHVPGRL
jgi:hypothetical protein